MSGAARRISWTGLGTPSTRSDISDRGLRPRSAWIWSVTSTPAASDRSCRAVAAMRRRLAIALPASAAARGSRSGPNTRTATMPMISNSPIPMSNISALPACFFLDTSDCVQPAVHGEVYAAHVSGPIRAQEEGYVRDVSRSGPAPQRWRRCWSAPIGSTRVRSNIGSGSNHVSRCDDVERESRCGKFQCQGGRDTPGAERVDGAPNSVACFKWIEGRSDRDQPSTRPHSFCGYSHGVDHQAERVSRRVEPPRIVVVHQDEYVNPAEPLVGLVKSGRKVIAVAVVAQDRSDASSALNLRSRAPHGRADAKQHHFGAGVVDPRCDRIADRGARAYKYSSAPAEVGQVHVDTLLTTMNSWLRFQSRLLAPSREGRASATALDLRCPSCTAVRSTSTYQCTSGVLGAFGPPWD